MHSIELRLIDLNIQLPEPPKPVASYVPAVRYGNLLQVSGQLPMRQGSVICQGPVPSAVSLEQAAEAAGVCVINALAILHREIEGDWRRLGRIVRLGVFVQCDAGFADQPKVANGASDLLVSVLGDIGRHARAAVGVNALPLNATVEVELTAELI